jgi:hypothetical protein
MSDIFLLEQLPAPQGESDGLRRLKPVHPAEVALIPSSPNHILLIPALSRKEGRELLPLSLPSEICSRNGVSSLLFPSRKETASSWLREQHHGRD